MCARVWVRACVGNKFASRFKTVEKSLKFDKEDRQERKK